MALKITRPEVRTGQIAGEGPQPSPSEENAPVGQSRAAYEDLKAGHTDPKTAFRALMEMNARVNALSHVMRYDAWWVFQQSTDAIWAARDNPPLLIRKLQEFWSQHG